MNDEEIFHQALARADSEERATYLERACAGDPALRASVEALLRANVGASGFLVRPVAGPGATVDAPAREGPGAVIGPYKLIQEIAEGGMGTVFLAEQTHPVRRRVALKIIKPGMDTRQVIARFEAERQALALMDHPNIAKVLDAGATPENRPYFAMELVKGLPITKYCDGRRLSVRERLELFVSVCQAVQHAHQKGVIHRDLKPSNVLVAPYDGEPVVKVIDFGVAKAAGQSLTERTLVTGFGAVVGTLEYMSPEQAELNNLDIDTRSDIYSLGVLLYELLTGTTPLPRKRLEEAAFAEVLRIIREEEPPRPSTRLSTTEELPSIAANRNAEPAKLSGLVRGELDWIVMKALEKDRGRRYETANGLAMDVQRYLHDEPVQACPPSAGYRLRKFVRRNKIALLTAGLVATALLLGTAISIWQAVRATGAEWLAHTRLKEAEEARQNLEWSLYFQSIGRAHLEWWNNDVGRADQILDECPAAYRHWEWFYLRRLCHAELFTFRGHTSWVRSVAFSPDGLRLASGGLDKTVRIWDLATGREIITLRGHKEPVLKVAFSPDGRCIASGGGDWESGRSGELKLWDLATGRVLRDLTGHQGAVADLAFGPDGQSLVAANHDGPTRLWDLATGQTVHTLPGHDTGAYCVAFSPDSKRIASSGWDRAIKIWDARDGRELFALRGSTGDVWSLAFSPDGRRLLSGSWDGTARLWDLDARRELHTLRGHAHLVAGVAFSPDGRAAATASADGCVKLWDPAQGTDRMTLRGHTGPVTSVAFSASGRCLVTGSRDQTVKVWDTTNPQPDRTISVRRGERWAGAEVMLAFSPDGRRLAAAARDPFAIHRRPAGVQSRDAATGRSTPFQVQRPGGVLSVAFSPDGRHIAADWGTAVRVWDEQTGRAVLTLESHAGPITAVAFDPDGRRLASGSEDRTLKVWDLSTRAALCTLAGHTAPLTSVDFHPDGRRVASASRDGTVRIWGVRERRTVLVWAAHTGPVNWVAFSPDGQYLASGGDDRTIRIWDTTNGRLIRTLPGHASAVTSVCYAPDGRRLASGSMDGSVRVWDTQTGQEALTLRGPFGGVRSVAFSPDGRRLAAGAQEETIRFWDTVEEGLDNRDRKVLAWHALEVQGFEARGQWRSALSHLDCLIGAQPADAPLRSQRARALERLGERDKALAEYTVAIELNPQDPSAWCSRGEAFVRLGRQDEALADYAKAIELKPHAFEIVVGRGEAHARFGQWGQARADYTNALELVEDSLSISILLEKRAKANESLGRFQEALADYNTALERTPDRPGVSRALAWFLATAPDPQLRDAARAVELATKASDQVPKEGHYWNTLGVARYRAGDWPAAIQALKESMQFREGGDGLDWFVLAMAHWRLGQEAEARQWYDRAVEWMEKHEPRNEELRRFCVEAEELLGVNEKTD